MIRKTILSSAGLIALAFALVNLPGCGDAAAESQTDNATRSTDSTARPATRRRAIAKPNLIDVDNIDWPTVHSKTHIIAFFSQRMTDLVECLETFQQLHEERKQGNLSVIAVCLDSDRPRDLRALLAENGLTLPVALDLNGTLREQFEITSIPHVFFFGEGRRYLGSLPGFPDSDDAGAYELYTNLMRRSVGLEVQLANDPLAVPMPDMPSFSIDGTDISSTSLRGAPYIVTFVAAGCDRCKAQLQLFKQLHADFADTGLRFLPVLVDEDVDPEQMRAERDLPFAIHGDIGGQLRRDLRYRGLVPDTFVVDAEGRIRYRHTTYDEEQSPLFRMELRRLLNQPNPPILKSNGPSGVRRCMVCHEREYFDWHSSGHAHAMRSLQAIGKAEDPKCVSCHVVGFGKPGGFDADGGARAPLLSDVQCENCHGNGGPHAVDAAGNPVPRTPITEATCTPCHDHEHSLGFDFDKFKELVQHRSDLLHGDPAQQERLAKARDEARQRLLEPDGKYVGAAACRTCHEGQFERWQGSTHARAAAHLDSPNPHGTGLTNDCARCHVTGIDRPWAEKSIPAADDPNLKGVQCESCHGPGQNHITAGGSRDAIIGLGERCEECVIRQVCTTCHDSTNDPEFDLRTDLPPMQSMCKPSSAASGR